MAILSRSRTIKLLRITWTALALWLEYGVFWYSVRKCGWPDSRFQMSFTTARPTHVLVVADPQILDHRSYPGRLPILTYISQVLVDLNIRKSWRQATRLKPDAVLFLGDMMDGGRFPMSDAEYEAYYNRFRAIFTLDHSKPQYFIPGNHDVGLRTPKADSKKAHERYTSHFGPLNHHVSLAGHNLVMLDAPGLAEEDYLRQQSGLSYADWRPIPGGPIQFVQTVSDTVEPPVILLSHIPLYRPDNAYCGPLREHGTIQQGFGESYQNVLGQQATNFLLRELKPSLILSGDDHDYCEHNHTVKAVTNSVLAREVTVKSLSMAMNVRRPGFQLLSLLPSQYRKNDAIMTTYADELCLLPDQISIYLSTYVPLLLFSLLMVLLVNVINRRSRPISNESGMSFQRRTVKLTRRSTLREVSGEEQIMDDYYNTRSSLPLPAPASAARRTHVPPQSWSSVFLGRRRRISFPEPFRLPAKLIFLLVRFGSFGVRNLKHRGTVRNFIHDVGSIAAFPLSVIILVSLWTMSS